MPPRLMVVLFLLVLISVLRRHVLSKLLVPFRLAPLLPFRCYIVNMC